MHWTGCPEAFQNDGGLANALVNDIGAASVLCYGNLAIKNDRDTEKAVSQDKIGPYS